MAKVIAAMTAFSLGPLAIAGADELALPIRVGFIGLDSQQSSGHEG